MLLLRAISMYSMCVELIFKNLLLTTSCGYSCLLMRIVGSSLHTASTIIATISSSQAFSNRSVRISSSKLSLIISFSVSEGEVLQFTRLIGYRCLQDLHPKFTVVFALPSAFWICDCDNFTHIFISSLRHTVINF